MLPIPLLRTSVIDRYCRKCFEETGKREYLVKNEHKSNKMRILESGYKYLPIVRLHSPYMKSTNMFILTIENISFFYNTTFIKILNTYFTLKI